MLLSNALSVLHLNAMFLFNSVDTVAALFVDLASKASSKYTK